MKLWIKRTLIGVAAGAVLVTGLADAFGSHWRDGHGRMSDERVAQMRVKAVDKISDKLNLDQAQKQKLAVLADEVLTQRKAFMSGSADPRSELQAVFAGEKFDRTRALGLLEQKTAVVQSAGPKLIAAMGDFYDSLNAEQQKQVRERMSKHNGGRNRD